MAITFADDAYIFEHAKASGLIPANSKGANFEVNWKDTEATLIHLPTWKRTRHDHSLSCHYIDLTPAMQSQIAAL